MASTTGTFFWPCPPDIEEARTLVSGPARRLMPIIHVKAAAHLAKFPDPDLTPDFAQIAADRTERLPPA